jgi:hypothetical protein
VPTGTAFRIRLPIEGPGRPGIGGDPQDPGHDVELAVLVGGADALAQTTIHIAGDA